MALEDIFTQFPVLTTEHLVLRQIQPDDAEAIFATFSDDEAMEFYGDIPHRSLDDSKDLIRRQQEWYARHEGIRWGITRKGDEEVIGSCGLFNFNEESHYAEIGYELRRAYWRQGIMREALSTVISFAFDMLALHRIEADVVRGNERSQGLLLKLGFTHEGTLRQRFFFRGCFWDDQYFGLLADEWQKR